MLSYNIIALDPSMSNTGLCILRRGYEPICTSLARGKGEAKEDYWLRLYNWILTFKLKRADIVAVEGYAFAANTRSLTQLAEVGGIVRFALKGLYTNSILEVPSTTWKAVALGDGKIKKTDILELACRKYHTSFNNQDECDAFLIAKAVEIAWLRAHTKSSVKFHKSIVQVLKGDS